MLGTPGLFSQALMMLAIRFTILLLSFELVTLLVGGAERCDPIPTFADGKVPRREIFVAAGSGGNREDGSRGAPITNLARAIREARAGDAIRILPGEYPGFWAERLSGTERDPIWIGGVPGMARPIIKQDGGSIHLSRVRYLILENLEVVGAKGNGINCDDGGDYANSNATRHVVFRNLLIREVGTGGNNDGLKLSGVNDFFVLDSEFGKVSRGGSAIDQVGCHSGRIAGCVFTECGNAIQCKGGTEDVEIRGNRFVRAFGRGVNVGGSTGFAFFRPPLKREGANFEARNIRVVANIFENSMEAPVAFVGAEGCLAANNTIINPKRWVVRILQETVTSGGFEFPPCRENEFSNNLIYYRRGDLSTHVNVGANTAADSFTFAHNLWYAHDEPGRSAPELPVRENNGVVGREPAFGDLASGDFRPKGSSPAAGAGKGLEVVKGDFSGRCFARPPSIGALEVN